MNETYKFSETKNSIKRTDLSENEIKTINNLGLTFEDLEKLLDEPHFAEGSYALIFDLPSDDKKVVAKVWKNPKDNINRAKHENVALRLLRIRNSEEAPKSMGYLKSKTILFEEKIEGAQIKNFDKTTIKQLAETIAKVHSVELNSYGKPLTKREKGTKMDFLNGELEKLRKNLSLLHDSSEITSVIEQAINKIENEAKKNPNAFQNNNFTLIHFDLNKNNILREDNSNKLILIDWEQASAGDNAMDVAKLFLKLNFDDEQKKDFIVEYEKKLPKKDEYFQDRLNIHGPLVLINSILWRLRVLRDTPQNISSINEKQFYERVKNNLDYELITMQNFLKDKN
ncbi:MAG: phosphotransferase [Candidatus Falkowbacteria bacterium]